MSKDLLLEVKNLKTYFYTDEGVVRAVDGISFDIKKGETLGMIGESGCGKSVSALSIMRLISEPPGRIMEGEINFQGENLREKSEPEMRRIRGNEIAMVFQEPMTSLNPLFTIGDQIAEAIILHQKVDKREAQFRVIQMLGRVGMPSPERRAHQYPHQLSGGMRQRAMIAMALSCNPDLLIADEPTTALDVTIQAQILELMERFKDELGMALLLITHNLGVIAEVSDRVVLVYAGKTVEYADVEAIFKHPRHPYMMGLLESVPRLDDASEKLKIIKGVVPTALNLPKGCRFHPRCEKVMDVCEVKPPRILEVEKNHGVRCWLYDSEGID
ncbi:MAG: ABC transporter ATP-binding protein [Candidatus Aerophobus sp.]|nr:MAG: ABC transporter ATP-binding protein [Candidatus Aerophobus sp.]